MSFLNFRQERYTTKIDIKRNGCATSLSTFFIDRTKTDLHKFYVSFHAVCINAKSLQIFCRCLVFLFFRSTYPFCLSPKLLTAFVMYRSTGVWKTFQLDLKSIYRNTSSLTRKVENTVHMSSVLSRYHCSEHLLK